MFHWAYQLSSKPTFFTCIFKTVIPDCHFLRNLKFYLHSPHHSPTVKLYVPFLWMGFNCLKARDTLRGSSLLFTTNFPEIPGTHSIRCIWPQQPYRCPASSNTPNIHQWNILSLLDKIAKKCSPNGNRYIFSADLTRLTKMFSLSCLYLYILNMYAKTASYRPFSLYFFFP